MECSKWIAKTPTGTSKLSQEQNSHWGGYYNTRTPKKKKKKKKQKQKNTAMILFPKG